MLVWFLKKRATTERNKFWCDVLFGELGEGMAIPG